MTATPIGRIPQFGQGAGELGGGPEDLAERLRDLPSGGVKAERFVHAAYQLLDVGVSVRRLPEPGQHSLRCRLDEVLARADGRQGVTAAECVLDALQFQAYPSNVGDEPRPAVQFGDLAGSHVQSGTVLGQFEVEQLDCDVGAVACGVVGFGAEDVGEAAERFVEPVGRLAGPVDALQPCLRSGSALTEALLDEHLLTDLMFRLEEVAGGLEHLTDLPQRELSGQVANGDGDASPLKWHERETDSHSYPLSGCLDVTGRTDELGQCQ